MTSWPLVFSVSLCFVLFSRTTSSLETSPWGGRSRVCIFNKEAVSLKTHPFFFLHDRSLPRAFLKTHQGHLKRLPLSPNSLSLEFIEYKEKQTIKPHNRLKYYPAVRKHQDWCHGKHYILRDKQQKPAGVKEASSPAHTEPGSSESCSLSTLVTQTKNTNSSRKWENDSKPDFWGAIKWN